MAIDGSGNIYVADAGNNRIQKFDSSGAYLAQWGGPGSGNGQFYNPQGMAIDGSDNIYVHDYDNHRIQVPLWSVGGPWPGQGKRVLRIAAQLYNSLAQYQYLADALAKELKAEQALP